MGRPASVAARLSSPAHPHLRDMVSDKQAGLMGSGESWPGGRAPLAAHVRVGVRVRQMCWARLAHDGTTSSGCSRRQRQIEVKGPVGGQIEVSLDTTPDWLIGA